MMDAAWLLVPAVAVVLVFVIGSWVALRNEGSADRVASVGFWASCAVAVLLMGWLMIDRGLT